MPTTRAKYHERREAGYSGWCAEQRHGECTKADTCKCACHAAPDAEAVEGSPQTPASAAARRAWATRRGEQPPKRPELRPGKKAPVSAGQGRQIKSELALLLWGADNGAAKLWPRAWITPEDRLTDDERTMLVSATYAELEARFPQALVWLAKVSESATEAQLLYVAAIVAAPRLARHGFIPPELASAIVFAPLVFAQHAAAAEQRAAAVDPERAPERDRANGLGQIDIGGASAAGSPLQGGVSVETGLGDVRHGPNDQNGRGPGRYPP